MAISFANSEGSLQRLQERFSAICTPRGGIFKPYAELEFLKSLWGLGIEEEEGYRTGSPGYIGWRNSFLGINSGAPYAFKTTGSDVFNLGTFDL